VEKALWNFNTGVAVLRGYNVRYDPFDGDFERTEVGNHPFSDVFRVIQAKENWPVDALEFHAFVKGTYCFNEIKKNKTGVGRILAACVDINNDVQYYAVLLEGEGLYFYVHKNNATPTPPPVAVTNSTPVAAAMNAAAVGIWGPTARPAAAADTAASVPGTPASTTAPFAPAASATGAQHSAPKGKPGSVAKSAASSKAPPQIASNAAGFETPKETSASPVFSVGTRVFVEEVGGLGTIADYVRRNDRIDGYCVSYKNEPDFQEGDMERCDHSCDQVLRYLEKDAWVTKTIARQKRVQCVHGFNTDSGKGTEYAGFGNVVGLCIDIRNRPRFYAVFMDFDIPGVFYFSVEDVKEVEANARDTKQKQAAESVYSSSAQAADTCTPADDRAAKRAAHQAEAQKQKAEDDKRQVESARAFLASGGTFNYEEPGEQPQAAESVYASSAQAAVTCTEHRHSPAKSINVPATTDTLLDEDDAEGTGVGQGAEKTVLQQLHQKLDHVKAVEHEALASAGVTDTSDTKDRTKWMHNARVTFYRLIQKKNPWRGGDALILTTWDEIATELRAVTAKSTKEEGRVYSNGQALNVFYREQKKKLKNAMKGEDSASGQAGFTEATLKAAGAKTEEKQAELKAEWGELQKVLALQDAYDHLAKEKRSIQEQLKNYSNVQITLATAQQAAKSEPVQKRIWININKQKKALDKKLRTAKELEREYVLTDQDKETMAVYNDMKPKYSTATSQDEHDLDSIPEANKGSRTMAQAIRSISDSMVQMQQFMQREMSEGGAARQPAKRPLEDLLQELEAVYTNPATKMTKAEYESCRVQIFKRRFSE
jgi:hypothetical protein